MAKKKEEKGDARDAGTASTKPKFPYTTKPGALRKVLKEIPKRPKPDKFNAELLKAWGFRDTNDSTVLRVLKAVNLLKDGGEPTETYTRFMNLSGGAKALGPEIKRLYAPLFQASHKPFNEDSETLKNLFNIHSGGGDKALELQIQTFKGLSENASFDDSGPASTAGGAAAAALATQATTFAAASDPSKPIININLHIHLPENKSRRDYEDIIEDIGRYIFGRDVGERRG